MNVLVGQAAQAPNITGAINAEAYGGVTVRTQGAFQWTRKPLGSGDGVECFDDDYPSYSIAIDASRSGASTDIHNTNIYTQNGELRTINFTYKLWKRVN